MSDPEPKRITERKALVIGINAYTRKPLSNCRNDASAMHEALKRMGFTSTLILDCDIGKFAKGTRLFVSSANSGDIAFFYFAGHGVEAAITQAGKPTSSNWLLACEVPEINEDLPRYALDAHNLLAELEARGARFNALVLDCCRNNPLPQHASTRSLGGGGLALMDPKGSLVAFGCARGETSAELPGSDHGVFTEHLLKHIETPGLELNNLFIRVRNAVVAATSHLEQPQTPYVNYSLSIENASLLPVDPVSDEESSIGNGGKRHRNNGEASTRSLSRPSADAALTWAAALEGVAEETLKTYKGLQFSGVNLPAPIGIDLPAPIEYVGL